MSYHEQRSSRLTRVDYYTNERVQMLGELNVSVRQKQQEKTLPLIVVAGYGHSLFGRKWMKHIRMDWKISWSSESAQNPTALHTILKEHDVFKDELGTIRAFPAYCKFTEARLV